MLCVSNNDIPIGVNISWLVYSGQDVMYSCPLFVVALFLLWTL